LKELLQKVEGQLGGRITGINLCTKDDAILTTNEDRTLRVLLKRDSGQYWPSIIQDLPHIPTKLYFVEAKNLFEILFEFLFIF